MVEALAARRAIVFAKELCLQSVVVEGDSLRVIQAIVAAKSSRTMFGNVIADIHYLESNFIVVFVMLKGRAISLLMPLSRRAVASTDFNV